MPVKITPEHKLFTLAHELKLQAIREHRYITPVARRKTFDDCFMVYGGKLTFWFNKRGGSTVMVSAPIPEAVRG